MSKEFLHVSHHVLTYSDRLKLEHMYNKLKLSKKIIADTLGVCRQTIYAEIKKGMCPAMDKHLKTYYSYSADLAQKKTDYNNTSKGRDIKLGSDYSFVEYIRYCIIDLKYSPAVALQKAKQKGFSTTVSIATLYKYIDEGLILGVTRSNLPLGRKKRAYTKISRVRKINVMYPSIEDRPREVLQRSSFGHWELDTVHGTVSKKTTCLMVLTERKTRYEIVMKLEDRTQLCVQRALDKLELVYPNFRDIFKTVSCDNGSEFSPVAIETSIHGGRRTRSFFCHPFCSSERGSNENANRLIRRHIPKGSDMQVVTDDHVSFIQSWMNEMPRKLLSWRTAADEFSAELAKC